MQIKVKQQDRGIIACLYGELDHHSAMQTRESLDRLISMYQDTDLVLDLKNLSFMDSSGLGVIIGRYKKLKSSGRSLYVTNPSRQIDKVMNVSGLYSIIKKL
jgi:stage II sporulation protein AA (anti-sigma F factor antagonist)